MARCVTLLIASALLALVAGSAAAADQADAILSDQVEATLARDLLSHRRKPKPLPKCPAGFVRNAARKCVCKPGYEYEKSSGRCITCPAGTFKPGQSNGECRACFEGRYVGYRGALECLPCKKGLVTPDRTRCQAGCKASNDGSVLRAGPFWAVNTHVFFRGGATSAAQVCDSLRKKSNGGQNLIPAVIRSSAQAKEAARLAEFAFACERQPNVTAMAAASNAWILKGAHTPNPPAGQCTSLFHMAGSPNNGKATTLTAAECTTPAGQMLPVLCSRGCARLCETCGSHGRCKTCLDGYMPVRGVCHPVMMPAAPPPVNPTG